jgi:peptidoglycan/xylan/chitin deacetylase (PgdA/CDA1 family)
MRVAQPNRAATALFQLLGGRERWRPADAYELASTSARHEAETWLLAIAVPLITWLAAAEALLRVTQARGLAALVVGAAALPAAALALHGWCLLVGSACAAVERRGWMVRRGLWQARLLLAALTAWALWAALGESWARWPAAGWLGLVAANLAAWTVCGWLRLMRVGGQPGVMLRVVLLVGALAGGWPAVLAAGPWMIFVWPGLVIIPLVLITVTPNARWFGPLVRHLRPSAREVWLTIDDGPDPHDTPRLLDLLDAAGAKATFFLIGTKAAAHPELVREIVSRGHELGNHSMTHPAGSFWAAGPARQHREIGQCQQVLTTLAGAAPRWFRAPVGHRNWFTHPVAAAHGLAVVGWDARGYDALERDVDLILRRIEKDIHPGAVLLVHEATPVATEVMRRLLARLAAGGFAVRLPRA